MTSDQLVGSDNMLWSTDAKEDSETPSHEDIATLAYELWEARGGIHGGDERDWLEAEHRLREGKVEAQSA